MALHRICCFAAPQRSQRAKSSIRWDVKGGNGSIWVGGRKKAKSSRGEINCLDGQKDVGCQKHCSNNYNYWTHITYPLAVWFSWTISLSHVVRRTFLISFKQLEKLTSARFYFLPCKWKCVRNELASSDEKPCTQTQRMIHANAMLVVEWKDSISYSLLCSQ